MKKVYLAITTAVLLFHAQNKTYSQVKLNVYQDSIAQQNFEGMGYNIVQFDNFDDATWNNVLAKRMKEVNSNGLNRFFIGIGDYNTAKGVYTWDSKEQQNFRRILGTLKSYNTDVYLTNCHWCQNIPTYLKGGKAIHNEDTLKDWADVQYTALNKWYNTDGFTNIKYWAVTNEMQTTEGGNYFGKTDPTGPVYFPLMPLFRKYNQLVFDRLKNGGLSDKIKILGDDNLGIIDVLRGPLKWTKDSMDALIGIYGWHAYPHGGEYYIEDPDLNFEWNKLPAENGDDWFSPVYTKNFLKRFRYGKHVVESKGKGIVIGEYGGPGAPTYHWPDGRIDTYKAIDESAYGIFMAERTIGLLSYGASSMMPWTFYDLQGHYGSWTVYLKHGMMKDHEGNWETRPVYYAMGILSRYFRKNSTVFKTKSSNELVRVTAAKHKVDGKYTVAITSRETTSQLLTLDMGKGLNTSFRKFVYTKDKAPVTVNGDLPSYTRIVKVNNGILNDTIAPDQLVLYTNEYDEVAPANVSNIQKSQNGSDVKLTWSANSEADFSYYRIYRSNSPINTISKSLQINSTVATTYLDQSQSTSSYYLVTAVDIYGNESILNPTLTITEGKLGESLGVYPNPTTDKVMVSFASPMHEEVKLSIFNSLGQQVLQKTTSGDGVVEFNILGLPSGIYYLQASTNENNVIRKIVIK